MIRFKNARIMTLAGDDPFKITEGEVWTDGDKIAFIGVPTKEQLESTKFEREICVMKNLLMPSFKNAHTHSAMTFLRSYADDLPLQKWLFEKVFPLEAKLTGEDVYYFTKVANLEYLTSGITASFDMYFELDDYVKACTEMGFRSVMCGSVSGEAGRIKEVEENFLKYNEVSPLIGYRLGFHAEYTCDEKLLEAMGRLAEKYKAPVYTHNSETESEVEGCINKYGKTPTALFDSLGIYNFGGGGFHCVHMTEEDLDIFKKRGAYIVTNPGSNSKLASGIADIRAMKDKGIGLAIGTDGPASNNALDMFREMYLMTVLGKLREKDAAACDAYDVLYAATVGSAKAMGLDDCDTLEVGKQADIIMIDLKQPNMQPMNNIPKNIVYSGSKSNVALTMCAGKVLYENGKFTDFDTDEIYKGAQERAVRIQNEVKN
ncbi:MAG: amidohydrolase [Ruminococcus sp.]|nr:amidohydrolase [Ruminococcus sp.]